MELEIALISPPGAGSVREDIARSCRGRRPPGSLGDRDVAMYPHPRDADNLPSIDKIGVGEVIFGGQAPPINSIARCDLAQRVSIYHHMWYGATRTEGLRF